MIKFEFLQDERTNAEEIDAILALFSTLRKSYATCQNEPQAGQEKPKTEEPKAKKAKPKTEEPKTEEPKKEEPKKESTEEVVSIEQLRALIGTKVRGGHKAEVLAQMKTYGGAKNVSSVPESDRANFVEFLNGLN